MFFMSNICSRNSDIIRSCHSQVCVNIAIHVMIIYTFVHVMFIDRPILVDNIIFSCTCLYMYLFIYLLTYDLLFHKWIIALTSGEEI